MASDMFLIKGSSPVVDDLMFWSIAGHEALSRPSTYELIVLSQESNIQAKDVIGHSFDVIIKFHDRNGDLHERHCQGHAIKFTRQGEVGRYFRYQISFQSWFGLLRKRSNSRIFQEKTVLESLEEVFNDSPIKRVTKLAKDDVIGDHLPHRYCVQFDETDYKFASRLMEEEGIYYWFDVHNEPGMMHLSDTSDAAHKKLPATDVLSYVPNAVSDARFNEITRWYNYQQFDTGAYASHDSDFKAIKKKLKSKKSDPESHELADLEFFEAFGDFRRDDDAENLAKLRLEEIVCRRKRYWAQTSWPDVAVGRVFNYQGDPNKQADDEYLIAGCTFIINHPGYEGASNKEPANSVLSLLEDAINSDAVNAESITEYKNLIQSTPELRTGIPGNRAFLLTVQPHKEVFRPPRLMPSVKMPGPQTGIVVGPQGEEIHTDKFGRIKVHFHWDRYDESNEKSTAWIRVSQPWAGKGWGGYFIPRIGQEVIVDFLNGDPDRPVVIGRVYNDDQPIPYQSPTQSGFKTRSTPGGNSSNYNEIMFEDKKGSENLNIHAEKDMSCSVENDHSESVGHDQSVSVSNDQTISVKHDRKVTVTNNETKNVKQFQKLTVGKNQDNHIIGYQTTHVDIDHALLIQGNHKISVNGERNDYTKTDEKRQVDGSQKIVVKGVMEQKAAKMIFEAGHIDFKITGGNSIVFDGGAAPYSASFQKYTLVSNTNMDLMSVGDINQTSIGSNTTVLGSNSSGYIGSSSEANMGMARSTFLGLSMETALGLKASNFLGINIENTLAIKLESVAAIGIERKSGDLKQAPMYIFSPGAGGGGAGGGAPITAAQNIVGGVASVAALGLGVWSAASGVGDTLKQYEDAANALDEAANDPSARDVPGLSARLQRMANLARHRRSQGVAIAAAGAAVAVAATGGAAGVAIGVGGAATTAGALGMAGGVIAGTGGAAGALAGGLSSMTEGSRASGEADQLKPRNDGSVDPSTNIPPAR